MIQTHAAKLVDILSESTDVRVSIDVGKIVNPDFDLSHIQKIPGIIFSLTPYENDIVHIVGILTILPTSFDPC